LETTVAFVVTLIVAVAGGMLLNEWVKVLVHRQRALASQYGEADCDRKLR
jgi:hypothetical protein